ncbi:hypothetical protein PVL29_026628 [Vitis rotundifolia]|uniref:Uncharacterized protein n=1 Tax=Vitis rotundifolia TaxID=103349 RepID=A0AA38YGU9_VITRO|nr:hypothetical protein PVL29_026628 [Vitis rotundifolia]
MGFNSSVSRSTTQNLVTCICSYKLGAKSYLIIITWSKSLVSQCLSIEINDYMNYFEINSIQVDIYWDLSLAKFEYWLEPLECFYLAIVFNREIKLYDTKSQFQGNGQNYNLSIECDTIGVNNPFLIICIYSKTVMQVRHLRYKRPVEVLWDVHNWLFGPTIGNAIFIFQTYSSTEKLFDFLLSF